MYVRKFQFAPPKVISRKIPGDKFYSFTYVALHIERGNLATYRKYLVVL